jgi:hypothetical protein
LVFQFLLLLFWYWGLNSGPYLAWLFYLSHVTSDFSFFQYFCLVSCFFVFSDEVWCGHHPKWPSTVILLPPPLE